MKLIIFLLVGICVVQAKGVSQNKVTLTEKDAPLERVLTEIGKQTGMGFTYTTDIRTANKVDISVKNALVEEALDICFKNQPFTYAIVKNTIVVKTRQSPQPFAAVQGDPGKLINAHGFIYNEAGQPLAGADVIVKNTRRGSVTNAKGEFEIASVPEGGELVISFIGYTSQTVKVSEVKDMQVYLTVAKNELDKVVVQAYGTTSQRIATGNIGTLRAEEIARQPVMNVLEALQGQVPGAIVTNTSGFASGQVKVEIRGRNTINPDFPSDPLYIIDGVPLTVLDVSGSSSYSQGAPGFIQSGISSDAGGQSPLFSIEPSNIESIQVLKDADATAIYGSRGANGVILITTKKGKAGKSSFELNAYTGQTFITRTYDMANTQQYLAMRREALYNDGYPISPNYAPDIYFGDSTRYTDWQKYLNGKMGSASDINASLTGGNVTTTFRISAGYHYQRDMTAVSGGNNRAAFLLNLNHKSFNQRLTLSLSANFSYSKTNQISSPGSPNMAPDAPPIYDKFGRINFPEWDKFYGSQNANPFGTLLQTYSSSANFLTSNFQLSYEILKGFTGKISLGYNNAQDYQVNYVPVAAADPATGPIGTSNLGTSFNYNVIAEPQLELNTHWGIGKFSALAGGTAQKASTSGTWLQGTGITNDAVIEQINGAPTKFFNYNGGQYRYAGIFARLSYNIADKYIVNLNGRRDGSSRFGPGKQYGNFGSIGAAWVFSEENWIKRNLGFISFGKIRASYGLTGGDQIGDYQYLTQWQFGLTPYNGMLPLTPIKHTDSVFHWQRNKKLEIGLELSVFRDWTSLSVSRYINRTNDQLVAFPTPIFTGFGNVTTNSPADVENSGWEFILRSKIVDGTKFRLSTRFNIGINRNRLISYPNIEQSPFRGRFIIGQPLNIQRLLHCTGVDPQTGLYTFEDKNKDGQITFDQTGKAPDDSHPVDLTPKYDGSLTVSTSYNKIELDMMFYFIKRVGSTAASALDYPGDATNQPLEVIQNHWQKPGQIAEYAKFTTNPSDNSWSYYRISDGSLTDASFIRMQNLALSYSISGKRWQKGGVNEIKLSVRAQNIFVITSYKGSDPEVRSFSSLPLPRIITGGISFKF
jgi:TonB-linked SusC/RagA family outer membrane protein